MMERSEENLSQLFLECAEKHSVKSVVEEDILDYAKDVVIQVAQDASSESSFLEELSDAISSILVESGVDESNVNALLEEIKKKLFATGDAVKSSPKTAPGSGDAAICNNNSGVDSTQSGGERYVCEVENLVLMYGGGRLLLRNSRLALRRGHRYGIVGQNGAGKTTLLKMISSGSIQQLPPSKYKIVSVQHDVDCLTTTGHKDASVLEYAQAVFQKVIKERAKKKMLHGTSGNDDNLSAAEALERVGFNESGKVEDNSPIANSKIGGTVNMLPWSKMVSELSGGWKMRLSLATALLHEKNPDILLLDEPTNHLDIYAVTWLVDYLNGKENCDTSILVVSHDAAFLDRICTDVIHFDDQQLTYYEGNFNNFKQKLGIDTEEKAKALLDVHESADGELHYQKSHEKPKCDEKIVKLVETYDRNNFEADPALQAKLAENIDWSNEAQPAAGNWKGCTPVEGPDKLSFPIPGKLEGVTNDKKAILELKNVSFRYSEEGPLVLKDVSCKLTPASRVAVVGVNGAGKSTLMGLLSGDLPIEEDLVPEEWMGKNIVPDFFKHRNLRLAYIAQHHTYHLQEFWNCSPLVYMQKRFEHGYDEQLQKFLLTFNEDEQKHIDEMAKKMGKYGKRVTDLAGRQKRGKEIFYEVKWGDLDDSKTNTWEPFSKLKKMGVENIVKAYDERQQAIASGNDQRPLSNREICKHFESFGFDEAMVQQRTIGSFSMGQKSRLTLAAAMWIKPHCLMLDEPTNYIDQETLDALARALKFFRGAVIIISHMSSFVDTVCNEEWLVQDGRVDKRKKK